VLHATGARHAAAVAAALPPRAGADPAYVVVPYVERMDLAYAAADLALCRAGALSCAELAAVGLPAVYVPLPIGNGEQRLNALPVVRAGGGVLVEDARLDDVWVRREVLALLKDQQRLAAMGEAAARFGRRDADEAVARVAMSAAKGAA
jgi:UDP-N-acetylglucosamine--N-acetylmuramyl-(pentapeptide) pyrophosphoryl-undecaprenol N-acetylglucosamine transferase